MMGINVGEMKGNDLTLQYTAWRFRSNMKMDQRYSSLLDPQTLLFHADRLFGRKLLKDRLSYSRWRNANSSANVPDNFKGRYIQCLGK